MLIIAIEWVTTQGFKKPHPPRRRRQEEVLVPKYGTKSTILYFHLEVVWKVFAEHGDVNKAF